MTTEEKICTILKLANTWMGINRYARLSMEYWPHVEGDGFAEGDMVYEASLTSTEYLFYRPIRRVARTLDEVLDLVIADVRKALENAIKPMRKWDATERG